MSEKKIKIITVTVVVIMLGILVGCFIYALEDTIIPNIKYSIEKNEFFDQLKRYSRLDDEYVLNKGSGRLAPVEAYGERAENRYCLPGIPAEDMFYYEFFSFFIGSDRNNGVYLNPKSEIKVPVTDMECYGIEIFDADRENVIEVNGAAIENIRRAIGGVETVELSDGVRYLGFKALTVYVYLNEDRSFYWTGTLRKFVWKGNGISNKEIYYEIIVAGKESTYVTIEDDGELYAMINQAFFSDEQ